MKPVIFIACMLAVVTGAAASEHDDVRKAPLTHATQWQSFRLGDVTLGEGYFSRAMDLHASYLLSLEVDRLIPQVRRLAGLEPKGANYGGWEAGGGGCSYGHYMSGCAMMYATKGPASGAAFRERLEYMIGELRLCQQQIPDGWFLSGERGKEGFRQLKEGSVLLNRPDESGQPWNFNQNGNSWYGIHKVMAGLHDAYVYAGLESALEVLMPLAEYAADIVLGSNSDLLQSTFSVEQGGMGEVFADIYNITGDAKYLRTAERFNHINVIYPTANGEDVLFARHANDQIPKFVGVAKQYRFTDNELYLEAARNFWDIVTEDHTSAIGGNSCYERFGLPGEESKRLDFSSSETCNTYNMLKLSRQLFMLEGDCKYLDYYEHALYNHILASQDPDMAGCVTYYTTLMPGLMKQYSTPFDSFWCCVGTGMENHAKYGESIFFHNDRELLVNLYIPSELNWKEKGLDIRLVTSFPDSEEITLQVNRMGDFDGMLLFRYPEWVEGEPHFGYLQFGPIVLAGALGTEDMPQDRVSDNRELRSQKPLKNIPMLVGSLDDLESWIVSADKDAMKFFVKNGGGQNNMEFIPFFRMHHQRYSVYWKVYSPEQFDYRTRVLTDRVTIGDEADEKGHRLRGEGDSEQWHDFFWANNLECRSAGDGGWFSYNLNIHKDETKPYNLICRWWGDEPQGSEFDIYVDDNFLTTAKLDRRLHLTYVDDIYPVPAEWTKGKSEVTVSFRTGQSAPKARIFGLSITADAEFR